MEVDPFSDPAYDQPKSRYIVCGQANLDKSDFYQRDFLQYLHALRACFKLNAYGDIGPGMEVFGFMCSGTSSSCRSSRQCKAA